MMYIDDCLRSVVQFMELPGNQLKQRTYNVTAMSFTPEELVAEVRKHVPHLKAKYEADSRQKIGELSPFDLIYYNVVSKIDRLIDFN